MSLDLEQGRLGMGGQALLNGFIDRRKPLLQLVYALAGTRTLPASRRAVGGLKNSSTGECFKPCVWSCPPIHCKGSKVPSVGVAAYLE